VASWRFIEVSDPDMYCNTFASVKESACGVNPLESRFLRREMPAYRNQDFIANALRKALTITTRTVILIASQLHLTRRRDGT
jgi:hypothetical protein